jgi:hypothetical protein
MLNGKVGFHSDSCLEGCSVRFRVSLMHDVEVITLALKTIRARLGFVGCGSAVATGSAI